MYMYQFQMISDCPSCNRSLTASELEEGQCYECDFSFDVKQYEYALSNPEVYSARVETAEGDAFSVLELAKVNVEGRIIAVYGILAVTTIGIECLTHEYTLTNLDLSKRDWAEHMAEKTWINEIDFKKASEHVLRLS